jgi:hypothetical protein
MPELGKYRHYKGGLYEVISVAKHSETLEPMVVYKSLSDLQIWVRPLDIWESPVSDGSVRFEFIGE